MRSRLKPCGILILLAIIPQFLILEAAFPEKRRAGNEQSQGARPLKIGVASMITPDDGVKCYQDVIDYIG